MSGASARVRLGLFAALLAVVFGAAFAAGSVGERVDRGAPMEVDHGQHG